MRAGRQKSVHSAVMVSLLLAACSVLGVLSLSSTSSALLGLDIGRSSTSELEKPGLIKRITSRVPVVSSLLDKPSKPAPTPQPTQQPVVRDTPSTSQPVTQNTSSTASSKESPKDSSTTTSKKEKESKDNAALVAAPPIDARPSDVDGLQLVDSPFYAGDGRLIAAPATQAVATFAVLEPSAEGWRIFGIAWYWWVLIAAAGVAIGMWREKIVRYVVLLHGRGQLLLRPKR